MFANFLQSSLLAAAHLLAMNVAAAGPLVAIFVEAFAQHFQQPAVARVGQRLAQVSLAAFFVGTMLGLLNGYWLWLAGGEAFFSALGRMPSKVFFGVWELMFYVVCMGIYIAWWRWAPPRHVWVRVIHAQFALAAATNLLWHFPPLMILASQLALTEPAGHAIHASEFRELIFAPHIFSLCVHVWLASVATAGIVLAWLASGPARANSGASDEVLASGRLANWGVWITLAASLLQLPVGVWVLLTSPAAQQGRMLGADPLTTALLAASVLIAVGLLHQLANLALQGASRRGIAWSAVLLCSIVLLMSATLRVSRSEGRADQSRPTRQAAAEW